VNRSPAGETAMRTRPVLVCLTLLGPALLCSPNFVITLPFCISLACIVLVSCVSIALLPSAWPWIVLASGVGTFGGFFVGFRMYPPSDPIAAPLVPYVAAVMALLVMVAGLFVGVVMTKLTLSGQRLRRTSEF